MTVPPRLAMLFAEQSFLCRIYSINKVVVVVVVVVHFRNTEKQIVK